jgi:hypothetical protein
MKIWRTDSYSSKETSHMAKTERNGASSDTKTPRVIAPAMAIDAGSPIEAISATVPPVNGVDRDGRPYCGKHNCVMIAQSTEGQATYYRCKVPGCEEREKRLRGQVPREPVWCSQRNCLNHGVALEVVAERSNYASLVMCCPKCGFEVQTPRPGFEHTTRPAAAEDFAAR